LKNRKLNLYLYKLIGLVVIISYLLLLTNSYFIKPQYGDNGLYLLFVLIMGIYLFLPYIIDKIFISLALIATTIYYLLQALYFKMFEDYIYFNSVFSLYKEAKDYSGEAIKLFTNTEFLIIGSLVVSLLILNLLRRKKFQYKIIVFLTAMISLMSTALISYFIIQNQVEVIESSNKDLFLYNQSDRFIYDKIPSKKEFVGKFGIEMFLYRDLKDHYFYDKNEVESEKEMVKNFLADNLPYQSNEMTGIFENKHLYLIEAESLTTAAIDENLTPTLYKMINEGYNFINYNSPLLVGSTSDAETMVNTSLIGINNGEIVAQSYANNTYPTTIAKSFVDAGYTSRAMHNNYKLYYNRENYFPALGYPEFFDSYTLGVENLSSDLVCQEIMNWISVFDEKSFVFDVTYSGHQPYTIDTLYNNDFYTQAGSEEYEGYYKIVNEYYPNMSEEIKFYLAKNMSFDRAMQSLIETYEIMGKKEDLVIAIYGDHFVKGMSEDLRSEADQVFNKTSSLKDTPFFIYNSEISSLTIDKYSSNIDIMPTILNLFNIPYEKGNILGNDIFDERYKGFSFSPSWDIRTADFEYSLEANAFVRNDIDKDEALNQVNRYLQYQEVSNAIILNDYFREN